jgi:hypothetical protein
MSRWELTTWEPFEMNPPDNAPAEPRRWPVCPECGRTARHDLRENVYRCDRHGDIHPRWTREEND